MRGKRHKPNNRECRLKFGPATAVLLSTLFVYFNRPVTIRPRQPLFRTETLELGNLELGT